MMHAYKKCCIVTLDGMFFGMAMWILDEIFALIFGLQKLTYADLVYRMCYGIALELFVLALVTSHSHS